MTMIKNIYIQKIHFFYKSQKLIDIDIKEDKPKINLDEEKENDSYQNSLLSKESKVISNDQKETSKVTLTKSLSSTNDFQKIQMIFKK